MPMTAPTAVQEKAQRLEQLLLRIEGGEALAEVCAELEIGIDEKLLSELQGKYEKGGRSWQALLDGRYGHPQKANSAIREWLFERKRAEGRTDRFSGQAAPSKAFRRRSIRECLVRILR
jgi:hypothetical protein